MVCESKHATCLSCLNSNTLSPQLFPSLPCSFPLDITSHKSHNLQERRRGGPPSTPPFSCRELVLSPSRCSPRVISRVALCPQSKYHFPPLFPVLLTYLSLQSHRHCEPCQHPHHVHALRHGAFFFFSLSIPANLQYSLATSPPVPRLPNQPPRAVSCSSLVNDVVPLAQRAGQAVNELPPQVTPR